jgi:N-acetylmuramic acid 6-phosphate etherase
MSIMLTGSVKERRHASTMNIDRLSTLDMLKVIHQDDAQSPLPLPLFNDDCPRGG